MGEIVAGCDVGPRRRDDALLLYGGRTPFGSAPANLPRRRPCRLRCLGCVVRLGACGAPGFGGGEMTVDVRDQIGVLLSAAAGRGSFSAAKTSPADDLGLEVRGVGPVELPVSEEQARQLCALGRSARYGKGNQTLVDPTVRNTWEIPMSRVKIDKRRWAKTLAPVLERLRADLGLPDGCTLEAELHSMLVYAPGQFFVRHQDSEKSDDMVGSLVVTLPSSFTGGALEVEHRGETTSFRGSKKKLSFVAFYSDCRHQIKPVKSGYRVVLTYDLVLRGVSVAGQSPDAELVEELARCLEMHFAEPLGPSRLVYLLDHEYTQRGLSWSRLKGDDVARVSALGMAAERARCEAVLALVDVHETWSAMEPEDQHSWRGRYGYGGWENDEDEDGDSFDSAGSDEYELDELIESTVTLDSWLGRPDGGVEEVGLIIGEDEVCASTPSGDLVPRASEYEGYMGNWGNTLDRWYHRGALVVWPTRLDFAVRAEASPSWALDALVGRLRGGDLATARADAAMVAPFWGQSVARVVTTSLFTKAMRTARLLGEPATAAMLLKPFRLEQLVPSHAKALSALAADYGEEWTRGLIASWSTRRSPFAADPMAGAASLQRLCVGLAACGDPGTSVALILLRDRWGWLRTGIEDALRLSSPSRRAASLAELGRPVAALVEGAALLQAAELVGQVAQFLCQDDGELCGCAIEVLRAVPPSQWRVTSLDVVAVHCRGWLEKRVARPLRSPDDWSVTLPRGCSCQDCGALSGFLADPARRVFEWPLAKDRRRHVHSRIDSAELPVSHQTRRKGSPYTLVLTKTAALFEQEERARERHQADLALVSGRIASRSPRR